MVLDALVDPAYEQDTVHLDPGDVILFYPDGLIEARSAQEERLRKDRLERVFWEHRHQRAPQAIATLESAVRALAGGMARFDDVTIVVANRMQPGEERR